MAATRFPGFAKDGTLVLPISPALWVPPRTPVTLDGVAFEPKRELHLTIVGSELGALVRAALQAWRLAPDDAARAFDTLDWRFTRGGERRLLAKDKVGADGMVQRVMSIVERVTMPAMAAFHRWLAGRLGVAPVVPPPHVTLYAHGDPLGIGVPSEATLAELSVRTLSDAELAGPA
jgi:hypothetical protein